MRVEERMSGGAKPATPVPRLAAVVVGTNHRHADVAFRERLALDASERAALIAQLRSALPDCECFALSTCNRTEVYVLGTESARAAMAVRSVLGAMKSVAIHHDDARFYERHGRAAIEHIHRVATGIDSQMLGETQILQQVQETWEFGLRHGGIGVIADHLLASAMRSGRRARADTSISAGAVSVAFAAVSVAHKVFGDLSARAALVIGAGEIGTLAARHLRERHIGHLLVANRSMDRAHQVAGELRADAVTLDAVHGALERVDILITATSAPAPLIDVAAVRSAMKLRHNRTLLIADIGVPRDVAPQVRELDNVFLHDLDGLQVMIDQTLARRQREVPRVERIIDADVERFIEWHAALQSAPIIRELRGRLEALRDQEIARHAGHWSSEQRQAAEEVLRAFVNKLLHRPTTLLRDATVQGEIGRRRLDAVREVFGLDDPAATSDDSLAGGTAPRERDHDPYG
jgi:glutamyl-tRNA reductase